MKKPQFDLLILLVATALVTAFVLNFSHRHEITLYKARLGETLDRIHILEDELMAHGEQSGHDDHHTGAAHEQLAIDDTGWRPTVQLSATADSKSGWNVHINTTDFAFAPESVGQPPVTGEGHTHLYVDGVKVARVYAPWFHLDSAATGTVLSVTLNANNHSELTLSGAVIGDSITLGEPENDSQDLGTAAN